ncbi:cupin domain-containing protein [Marinigracilibium pacificum]|uniref:Uncharacterized protein n=1 Tax=Marinigracilibium pacificum TaxID=2729599 RepID=A0A848ITU9_9BACT|nr:hypothetical protein [Marinigracilibium pacificum]NMM47767.1 hypothetical protein [Marinigracilibium pacificum]
MDRRKFSNELIKSLVSFALLDSVYSYQAVGKSIKLIFNHWVVSLNEYCIDLKTGSLTPAQWQTKVEGLFNQIDLTELIKFIDLKNLTKGFNYPDLGVNTKKVTFPTISGIPEKIVFIKKVFGMKKDRAIIPHGHSNMVSAHLILNGEMHLRHYEKIESDQDHLIIKPTIDRIALPGDSSSISDEKNNIHWFIANSPTAFTFDIILLDLNNKPYDIHNIDIYLKEDLHNGTMRVPILDVDTALKKYGKHHH